MLSPERTLELSGTAIVMNELAGLTRISESSAMTIIQHMIDDFYLCFRSVSTVCPTCGELRSRLAKVGTQQVPYMCS